MSLVFQILTPHPPLQPASGSSPPTPHTRRAERGVEGQHFGRRETQDCPPSYSNNLSTLLVLSLLILLALRAGGKPLWLSRPPSLTITLGLKPFHIISFILGPMHGGLNLRQVPLVIIVSWSKRIQKSPSQQEIQNSDIQKFRIQSATYRKKKFILEWKREYILLGTLINTFDTKFLRGNNMNLFLFYLFLQLLQAVSGIQICPLFEE